MNLREEREGYPLVEDPYSVSRKWEKLIWRLNKLEPGKRYTILVTVGQEPDWTITELGKIER